jgi:methyltransferase (TIGR00027 family)
MIEQYQPQEMRMFEDPVAQALVGGPIRMMMHLSPMRTLTLNQTDAVAQGIYGVQICRTRYIDEAVRSAVSDGMKQLVILGAGYDTRAYRLSGLEGIRVFELDLPAVQQDKEKKLRAALHPLPGNVTFVPIDFDAQALEQVLVGTAFDPGRPAFFLWEGVTQYITEEAVRRTLAYIGKLTPGSQLLFTYVLKSIIEDRSDIPDAAHLMEVVAKQSPWIFGLDPAEIKAFLQPYRLTLTADVGAVDFEEKYLKPIHRSLVVFSGERTALAAVRA